MNGQNPREIAARILQHRPGADFVEHRLEEALASARLSPADRGLCQELVYGVSRWRDTLDFLIAAKTPGRAQKPALQDLLRLGLYQIFWLDRIPPHAAVHETVAQAKRAGFGPQAGFVNAILRGYLRDFSATKQQLAQLKQTQPPLGYSQPAWLVTRWQERWGFEMAAQLLEWNNTPAPTFARVNALKTTSSALLEQWRGEGVEWRALTRDWLPEELCFELTSHPPLATLPSFQQGGFYVQDPSTLLAVHLLGPQPGETVLDLCAAPGGKTTYIAQCLGNRGRLVAHDPAADRLERLLQNCVRLGVTCVEATSQLAEMPGEYDRILVDAPCSNTGVLRRRVDLRWRISREEMERLRATQLALLGQAVARLKSGGTLVYSTCSLEPEENQLLVHQFLQAAPQLRLEHQRELLPFSDRVDGAFVARFGCR